MEEDEESEEEPLEPITITNEDVKIDFEEIEDELIIKI